MDKFTELTVAGWGLTEPWGPDPSDELMEVTLKHYPRENCSRDWEGLDPSQFCAGDYGKGVCWGDSGSPAMVRYKGRMSVLGITKRSDPPCGSKPNNVFTKVTSFLKWIKYHTKDAEYCNS
ncbi:Prophenoloxidase activating proteinase-2-like protein [Leptotrombidium deliense]|uniref:Prophenoloxidase activating proteinase-2-like protein n=1 Tax=Leptotrombidium deliense TaxID=299467 RepID=A0A443SA42_9ACAR|nr:Prophenoloxidase activating proteinase-2-like protein [Leptotrombidium deliense]